MAFKDKEKAIKYNNEFNKNAYDRINLTVPKGKKAVIGEYAKAAGQSINGYVKKAITDRIKADSGNDIEL